MKKTLSVRKGVSALFVCICCLCTFSLSAQYTAYTPTYSWVTPATSVSTSACDDCQVNLTIPFTFTFFGTGYTTCSVNTNGLMTFGSTSTAYANVCIPNTSAPNNFIAAFWDDLGFEYSCSPTLWRYQTLGTSPNRTFVVAWIAFTTTSNYSSGTCGSYVYTEIKLFETSNNIEVHLQSNGVGNTGTIGIENSGGTAGYQAVCNASTGSSVAWGWTPCTAPTSLTYTTASATYCNGVPTTDNNPGFSGSAATSYSISPDISANTGLSFNTSTGVISGTPTIASASTGYTVTVNNACGSTTKVLNIAVLSPVSVSLGASPTTFCVNNPTALTGSASGGSGTYSTYTWSSTTTGNGLAASSTASNTATPTVPGTQSYYLTVTDNNGCVGVSPVVNVNVKGATTVTTTNATGVTSNGATLNGTITTE